MVGQPQALLFQGALAGCAALLPEQVVMTACQDPKFIRSVLKWPYNSCGTIVCGLPMPSLAAAICSYGQELYVKSGAMSAGVM